MVTTLQRELYTLDMLRDEARALIFQGVVNGQQPIGTLCRYVSEREWACVEITLEDNEFLPRDRICDLFSQERWDAD